MKRQPANKTERRCRFENLETRRLMAGDVSFWVDNDGDLEIRGDHAGNECVFWSDLRANGEHLYLLRCENGTTINRLNVPEVAIDVGDVHGDININMRGGDDIMAIYNLRQNDNVNINTGTGNDSLKIRSLAIKGNLNIDTGYGNDDVNMAHFSVGQELHVETRAGNDKVWLDHGITGSLTPLGSESDRHDSATFTIDTGNGQNDTIWMKSLEVIGNIALTSGTGTNVYFLDRVDMLGNLDIEGRSGKDYVYMFDTNVMGNVSVNLGSNHDFVFIDHLKIVGDLTVHTGHGNDFVHGNNLNVRGRASFDGGHGRRDYLQLVDSVFFNWDVPVGFEGQRILP